MKSVKIFLKGFICFVIIVGISIYIATLFFILKPSSSQHTNADVIIVLGARSYKDGNYNPCLVSRVAHGVELHKKGFAQKIIMTGGNDREDNVNEAETMRKIAVELKIASESILLEKKATSTYENLVFSKKIMKDNSLQNAIIVTEPYHSYRAGFTAKKLDMNYTLSPATKSCSKPHEYFYRVLMREALAVVKYFLMK